jgi:hypothetical protein
MYYLTDMLAGKSESDLERAVDRFYVNKGMSSLVSSFFDPDRRKRQLEEKILQKYLTDDSFENKIPNVSTISSFFKPVKSGLSYLLR